MDLLFLEYWDRLVGPFLNPQKRVFVGYMGIALLIGLGVHLSLHRSGLSGAFAALFARRIWWSKSSRLDYKVVILNQAIMMGVVPRLITKLAIATFLFEAMHIWFNGRVLLWQTAPDWVFVVTFTATLFLLDDLSKYLIHRALHRWSVLWCFHKVHHTAETLTPLTVYRTHPVEGVIFALRSIAVQGVAVSVFMYCFGSRVELATVLGVNVFLFFFNAAGSNLRHSHVWFSYGRFLERFLISPAQHQIHHSIDPRHHDRNFGAVLAIWDWMGRSLCFAERGQTIRFGVRQEAASRHDLKTVYLMPFFDAFQCVLDILPVRRINMLKPLFSGAKQITRAKAIMAGTALIAGLVATTAVYAQELNIYSHRQPFLIDPFIKVYTKETGTKINIVYASKGLAQRLQAEGTRSPADVILTVDIARLNVYADKALLAPIQSKVLEKNVPAHLRDAGNRWFAFSKRVRVIVVSAAAPELKEIERYEDLADPKWRGRLCLRPGSHVYNRALVASFIHSVGEETAESWAKGMIGNLARRPQGNDRAQVKAIYEGACDISIINNYYFGKLKNSDKSTHRDWSSAVSLIFPNQFDRGAHVNISGGGVAKHSKNKEEAVRFLEFLTSTVAQDLYGTINFEYPVNPAVPASAELRSWGVFREDRMPIARIAELAPEAQRVIDRVGW
jgi:iron(III) transport system substrate-binding protein